MSRSAVIAAILLVTLIHLGLDFVPAMQTRVLLRFAVEIPMNVFGMLLMYPGIVRRAEDTAFLDAENELCAIKRRRSEKRAAFFAGDD